MERELQVPAVSTLEAEQFWTDGKDARQPATGAEPETNTTLDSERPMPVDLLCLRCGERGGEWRREQIVGAGGWGVLETNQRVASSVDESGRYIYAHICVADSVGIDLPGVGVMRPGISSDWAGRESAASEVPSPGLAGGVSYSAHGLCRNCGAPVKRDPDGTWTHENGYFCDGRRAIADPFDLHPREKEAVANGEARVGDGIAFEDFEKLIKDLGDLVRKAHPDSARVGLEVVTAAFGCLLDIYAWPNPENPLGMCDDRDAFRQYFAQMLSSRGGTR